MSHTYTDQRTVLADILPGSLVRDATLVTAGALSVGLAAQVSIPLPGTPVPMTLQTLAVLVSGAALGTRRGALSMALYALLGLAGLPWFAQASMASFGYIIGFVFAAAAVGRLAGAGHDRSVLGTVVTFTVGTALIFAPGVAWLMLYTGSDLSTALVQGVVPFLLGDVVKIAVAAGVLPATWRLVRRLG